VSTVPASELELHASALGRRLGDLDAILALEAADLYWLTGSIQAGFAYVPREGPVIYGVRRDPGRARAESGLAHVVQFSSPKDLGALLGQVGLPMPKKLGMELDVVPVNLFDRWRSALPGVEVVDASFAIRAARAVKTTWEQDRIKAAAKVADAVVRRCLEVLRPGISEMELAADLEATAIRLGHQGMVRMRAFNAENHFGQILAGPSGAQIPPGDTPLGGSGPNPYVGKGAGPRLIRPGEPVVVDIAVAVDGYVVDQTRTFSCGPLPDELVQAHADMVAVLEHALSFVKPGMPWARPHEEALVLAARLGHKDRFMGPPGVQAKFLGHGVGLELDELPVLAKAFGDHMLEEGMVIAIEPKVVFKDLGAVGIEDTFLVQRDGFERLTLPEQCLFVV